MTIQRELEAVWDAYVAAYRDGNAAGCAAVFTADAMVTSPYAPPGRGRAEIEAIHAEWVAEGGEAKSIKILEHGHEGDLAWCLVRFSEGAETGDGMSLNVFERQADGAWLIRMCSLNEDLPAQA